MKAILKISLGLLITIHAMRVIAKDLNINPGLWVVQHHGNMGSQGMSMPMPDATQMQAMMKNLPPEARAQMEKHMGKNGTAMMSGEGVKVCISPEQAARNDFPTNPSSKCKLIKNERRGNTITVSMSCEKGNMDAVVTINDATSWNSNMKGSMKDGMQNMTMDMQANGKWLGKDCGTLKPFNANPQATK